MNKTVFVSGATSGIGLSCARRFVAEGCRVIICGRRADRIHQLANELTLQAGSNRVLPLVFDIKIKEEVERAIDSLPQDWNQIDILINNAGLSRGLDPIQEGNTDHWEEMIDTNIKGLLFLTRKLVVRMTEMGSGHIINIGSVAGKEVYPNGNVYCATKFAVDALTKAMRIDLLSFGIKVSQIAPGAVETEFSLVRFDGDAEKAAAVYQGFTPLTPEDVADAVFYVASLPQHVNVNDMLLMPAAQAAAGIIKRK